jgi:hypothetical protein
LGKDVRVGSDYQTFIPPLVSCYVSHRPSPVLREEEADFLEGYVDILAEERYDPVLRANRRFQVPSVVRQRLAELIGESRVKWFEERIGATKVDWGHVAAAMGLKGDEATSFIAKREREPEVMGKRLEDSEDLLEPSKKARKLVVAWRKQGGTGYSSKKN